MGRIKGKQVSWKDLGFKANTFDLMRADGEIRELLPSDEMEFKGLTRQYFEKRNVHENRVLGQRIGLESATTLSKQDLIDKMVDKVWGVQYFSEGYKPVEDVNIDKISADVELQLLEEIKRGEVIIGIETSGVFSSRARGGVLCNIGKDFNDVIVDTCVLRNLVGQYALKDGDYVKGRVRYVEEVGFYALYHIDEINGKRVENARPSPNEPINAFEPVPFAGGDRLAIGLSLFAPVCYGQFGVVTTNGRIDFTDAARRILDALSASSAHVVGLFLKEKPAIVKRLKEESAVKEREIYCTQLGSEKGLQQIRFVLDYMSMQAKYLGKKEIVVVNDIDGLDKHPTEDGLDVTKLASYAQAYEGGGSMTVIGVGGTVSPMAAYYEIRNHVDFELSLKSTLSVSQTFIDMLSSYSFSDRKEKREETVALAQLRQIAVTDGNAALERRISGYTDAAQIIAQLNETNN